MTTDTGTRTRAWIGSLAAYSAGRLVGAWIDLDGRDADEIADAAKDAMRPMLGGMSEAEAFDELWVFDHVGLAPLVRGECNVSEAVGAAAVYEEIEENALRDAFDAYCANMGSSNIDHDTVASDFHDAYMGFYDSVEAYAEELLAETGALDKLPEDLRYYFDYQAYARDLVAGGDISAEHAPGGVYIFRNC